MPLNLKYPTVTRKSAVAKKADPSSATTDNRAPPPERPSSPEKPANSVTQDPRTRQPLSRKQTDTPPSTLARKPSQASLLSTVSKAEKKRSAWRGVTKTLPNILKSQRGASSSSLVSVSQEAEQSVSESPRPDVSQSTSSFRSKLPRRAAPSREASTSVEQDSTHVKDGSLTQASPHLDQAQDGDERCAEAYF